MIHIYNLDICYVMSVPSSPSSSSVRPLIPSSSRPCPSVPSCPVVAVASVCPFGRPSRGPSVPVHPVVFVRALSVRPVVRLIIIYMSSWSIRRMGMKELLRAISKTSNANTQTCDTILVLAAHKASAHATTVAIQGPRGGQVPKTIQI